MKVASDVMLAKIVQKVKALLNGKADSNHNHDSVYIKKSTGGIMREFDSGDMSVTEYTTPSGNAKVYLVEVSYTFGDTEYSAICACDWRMCPSDSTAKFAVAATNGNHFEIWASRASNNIVTFKIGGYTMSISPVRIKRVIGYY